MWAYHQVLGYPKSYYQFLDCKDDNLSSVSILIENRCNAKKSLRLKLWSPNINKGDSIHSKFIFLYSDPNFNTASKRPQIRNIWVTLLQVYNSRTLVINRCQFRCLLNFPNMKLCLVLNYRIVAEHQSIHMQLILRVTASAPWDFSYNIESNIDEYKYM